MMRAPAMPFCLITTASADERQRIAARWVAEHGSAQPVLLVVPSLEAGNRVLRLAADNRPGTFGWQRITPNDLALRLAAETLSKLGRVPAAAVVLEALCAR